MLFKLLQHLLIWLAASAVIVLGATWGYAVGFTANRAGPQIAAWSIALATTIFAAALVQRAPAAIAILVALCVPLFAFGAWLTTGGAAPTGVAYMLVSATYLACLGPSCRQWFTSRRS